MKVISDFRGKTIVPLLHQNVSPGSTIYTDGLQSFEGLAEAGFKPIARTQPLRSALRKGAKSAVPLADRTIGNLQQWLIGTYHGKQNLNSRFTSTNLSPGTTAARHRQPPSDPPWSRNRPGINRVRADPRSEGSQNTTHWGLLS
jgi:transposase-like protein